MTQTADMLQTKPEAFASFKAQGAPGYHEFLPEQPHRIGALLPKEQYPQNEAAVPKIFEPITIRGVEFGSRMWVAPMCQYSADNGKATDHHFVHLGSMAMRGWANVMVEATAVVPEGRISPEDMGLWEDAQIAPLKRIVDYIHAIGGKIGIQLAHAGRKASTLTPWILLGEMKKGYKGGEVVEEKNGGWNPDVVGPSQISFNPDTYPMPKAATAEYLETVKTAYRDATRRCKAVGFDFIELHFAHGYFMHEFFSPLSNQRTDQYGGSFENRVRLGVEIAKIVSDEWERPLLARVSASDWLEETLGPEKQYAGKKEEYAWWGLEQATLLAAKLRDAGVDLLDVSSGGNDLRGNITVKPEYQVPFAAHIRKHVPGLLIGAVGLVTEPKQAEGILEREDADIVLFGREVLRHIDFPIAAAAELGVAVAPAAQYMHAWTRMLTKKEITIPRS